MKFRIGWTGSLEIQYDFTMTNPGWFSDELQLGGLFGESGQLYRPAVTTLLLLQDRVEIRGDRLFWENDRSRRLPKTVSPSPRLLETFLRLVDARPAVIGDFARRWGILGICKHTLPRTHDFREGPPTRFCRTKGYRFTRNTESGWEPLHVWRRYAGQARAIVDVAAQLHQRKIVRDKDIWRRTHSHVFLTYPDFLGNREAQCHAISVAINGWLELGMVRAFLNWELDSPATVTLGTSVLRQDRPEIRPIVLNLFPEMQGHTLFGALGVQLLMAVSRTAGFATCSSCGHPYTPTRRPSPNRRRYCPNCGVRAAWRDAQQARRQKRETHIN